MPVGLQEMDVSMLSCEVRRETLSTFLNDCLAFAPLSLREASDTADSLVGEGGDGVPQSACLKARTANRGAGVSGGSMHSGSSASGIC